MGLRSWTMLHDSAETQEKIFLTQERLSQWISGAYRLDISRKSFQGEAIMVGGGQELEFSTALHADPELNGLYRVKIRLADENLEVGFAPDFGYPSDDSGWVWRTLAEGVQEFEARYMLGLDAANQIVWLDEWGGTGETLYLPKAIKLTLATADDMGDWPEQIIPLGIEEQAFCRMLADRTCLAGAFVE